MYDYVSLIAISGIIGIVYYWFFNALDLLNFFDHGESDEKNSLIILFGLIYFVISDLLRQSTNDNWRLSIYVIISIVLSFIIMWFILNVLNKAIDTHIERNTNKKSMSFYEPVIKKLLENDIGSNRLIYVYVYNLDDKIIEHGRLNYYSPGKNEESAISLELSPDSGSLETDLNNLRTNFPIDDSMHVYINFEHNYKIYIYVED